MAHQIDTDAKVITGDDYGFGHPAICRLSNTVMLAAHINQSDELEIHKSIDDGLNWTLKKTLTDASGPFNIVYISSTKAGLVYQKNLDEFEVWITTDSGENWVNKLDITGTGPYKAVLVYSNIYNRLHLVYQDGDWIGGKYSDNDGDNWTNWSSSISTYVTRVYDVDINELNGYVYISIYKRQTQYPWQQYRNSVYWFNGNGLAIGNDMLYESEGHSYHDNNLVIDALGNRYLAYIVGLSSKEKLVVRKNKGTPTILFDPDTDNIIVKGSSSIGVDEDDKVVALMLMETDDYDGGCMRQGELVCDESDKHYRKISELRDKVSPDSNIRILFGTRCC